MPVTVLKINKEKILERLNKWAKKIGEENTNVLCIVLFGSLVKDNYTPLSDADILIVLNKSEKKFHERIPDFLPTGIGMSVDIFPYTFEEFLTLYNEKNQIIMNFLNQSLILYKNKNFEINKIKKHD